MELPAPVQAFLSRKLDLFGQKMSIGSLLLLLVTCLVIGLVVAGGGTSDLLQGLFMGAVYAMVALGYTMVYGVLKMINFAHGDVFMWGAFWVYFFSVQLKVSFPVACFAAALLCALMGVVIERVAYRPLRKASRLAPLITAIGVSLLLEASAQLSFGTGNKRIVPHDSPILLLGQTSFVIAGDPVTVDHRDLLILGAAIAIMLALHFIVRYTKTGKAIRAVADDIDSARAVGIDVNRIISTTFAIGSLFAAIGGILFAVRFAADPYMGILPGIKAFTAAVVGGIGNIYGAMLGGILLGLAEFVGVWGLGKAGVPFATAYRDAIAFVILIIVLLFKPSGLFGREHLTLSRRK
jgi:branched-chain amino acid transport system permease protein